MYALIYVRVCVRLCTFFFQKRREDQERRARRGDTDPRYEYIFQVLATATGIPRHHVMDFVYEENLVSLFWGGADVKRI